MRIVHVIARLNVGGAALHVLQLAHEQRRRGHDTVVVAGSLAAGEESMAYVADELEVDVIDLPALQRELSPRSDTAAIAQLRRLVRARSPDVLHTHTAKAGATGRIAGLLAGRPRPTLVHTYHGHVLSGYFSPRRERVFRGVERLLAYRTDALVAVSEEVRDDLVGFGVAPAAKFAVVPYGFDLPEWSDRDEEARSWIRRDIGVDEGTFVFGWAGRLTAIKRPADLVRTLAAVLAAGEDAVLVVVGDGEEREATERLAAEVGVAERVRFVGFQRAIRDWYAAFDAALLTSANEGTPVAAIEALAAERPVVATDAGGTATVVRDGVSGLLAPIGDVDALAAHLVRLARDPALRQRLGRQGADDVRGRFATARMADELEAIYLQGRQ